MRIGNESGAPRRAQSSAHVAPTAPSAAPTTPAKHAASGGAADSFSASSSQRADSGLKPTEQIFDELTSIKANRSRKKAGVDPGSEVSVERYRDEVAGSYIHFTVGEGNNEIKLSRNAEGKAQLTVDGKTRTFDDSKVDHIIIDGGGGNDRITVEGDFGDKVGVWGGAGNDTIRIKGGASLVDGQAGDDVIYGGRGDDHLSGGEGNDRIYGGAGRDMIYGDVGQDLVSGGSGKDFISGGKGKDVIRGGGGDDELLAGKGEGDKVEPGAGKNKIGEDRY